MSRFICCRTRSSPCRAPHRAVSPRTRCKAERPAALKRGDVGRLWGAASARQPWDRFRQHCRKRSRATQTTTQKSGPLAMLSEVHFSYGDNRCIRLHPTFCCSCTVDFFAPAQERFSHKARVNPVFCVNSKGCCRTGRK